MTKQGRLTATAAMAAALAVSSCSYVLDGILAPFAPDYLPSLRDVADGVEVDDQVTAAARPDDLYEGKDVSWSMPYALYVFRSTVSPYDGMELAARCFVASAADLYTGRDARVETVYDDDGVPMNDVIVWTYPQYDFRLVAGTDAYGVENAAAGSSGTYTDRSAPDGELFYRLSRITLYRSVTETELTLYSYTEGNITGETKQKVTEISYSLAPSTSGWATIVNAP